MPDASDRCLRELKLDDRVFAIDWSPDGTRLAIGDVEGDVEVMTAEGRRLWRRVEHRGTVFDVRWSPDGHRLACGSNEVILVDTETGEKLDGWSVSEEEAWGVSWSPDGSRLAAGYKSGLIRLREERTHTEVAFPQGHTKAVRRLAWTQDGQRLASASYDDTVRVWNVQERRCVLVLDGHEGHVDSVSWSPDGTLLASGSNDRTIRIWSSESGEEVVRLDGHTGWGVWNVAFSPDGTRVASAGGADRTVRIWDVSDLVTVRDARPVSSSLDAYVARQAASVGRRPRRTAPSLWVPRLRPPEGRPANTGANGRVLWELKGSGKGIAGGVAVLPDSRRLAVGQADGTVRLVDLASGADLWTGGERHTGVIRAIACSRQG